MNKEPIGLYIFRFVLGLGLFAFMCMLYWSSTLIEDDILDLKADVAQLKNDLFTLRLESEKSRGEILSHLLDICHRAVNCANQASDLMEQQPTESTPSSSREGNLLQPDPFYDKVLPKLLGKGFVANGTQHQATVGKPNNLHPFSNWAQVSSFYERCVASASRSKFGIFETLSPDMALSIEEKINPETKKPEFWVQLRPNVFWKPLQQDWFPASIHLAPHFLRKHPVTAHDYKFYFDAMMNPFVQEPGAVALRTYYGTIEEVRVVDDLTFVVRWRTAQIKDVNGQEISKIKYVAKQLTGGLRPLPGFVYKYFANGEKIVSDQDPETYRTNSAWAQNFVDHWAKNVIVSCGPWVFNGMTDRQISFIRNPDFYFSDAALTASIELDFKDSPDNIWQQFKIDKLDSYGLQPSQLMEYQNFLESDIYKKQVQQGSAIKRLDYVNRSYTYVGWNAKRPFFQNAKLRRAMTMAIDRQRIIEQNLNGLGIEITGTFFRYSPSYDETITPWPYDPEQARRLLESEGWYDRDGDGIIDNIINGQKVIFRFTLTYYVKNATIKAICEYIATALKKIGVECHLNGVDIADLSSAFDDKSFDALCMSWSLGNPPEDPRQLWHSSGAKEKGSSNAVGFANAEVDAIIDKLDYEYDPKKRIELYHRFDTIIHQEQPYTFLFTPKVAFLYRSYLQNVFIPSERQDLVPGANVAEPEPSIFWLKHSPIR